jgi:hypothetical protein
MYGCYYSKIIYGFCEGNSDYILDSKWLYQQELEDIIIIGGIGVVRNYMGEACYGVNCSINDDTGKIEVPDEHKIIIEAFYKKFMAYNKINPERLQKSASYEDEDETPHLGYYTVIQGDYGVCQETYTLDE